MIKLNPILMKGKIIEVNDTAVKVDIVGRLGTICVPLRWVFTDQKLLIGQQVEFYFSYLRTVDAIETREEPT